MAWAGIARLRCHFEDCVLDTEKRELRRGADPVSITPQVFDLLEYLIRNRERVVSKDDFIDVIWKGRVVSDAAVATRLNAARTAIGDSGEEQRLIKTLPRKGFRFVGEVWEVPGSSDPSPGAEVSLEPPKPALSLPDKPSIAVLAFTNLSGDAGQEYFADGIVDDIITELSRFSDLFVIARNSSFQYKGKAVDVRQVGRELGVRYVLGGSIRHSGGRIRIGAQLIDAVTGSHRWAERYDRKLEDLFSVQDEVVHGIVTTLAAHVGKAEAERALLKPAVTWQAYDYCLRATEVLASYWTSASNEDLNNARILLERALAIDPNYARAYAALSRTHLLAWALPSHRDYMDPAAVDRAHELALKAVQLDPNLPRARGMLAVVLVWKRQHQAAVAEFERAVANNPNFANWNYAWVLLFAVETVKAIEVCKACMRLDPFYSSSVPTCLALGYYIVRKYADALSLIRESTSRSPNFRTPHLVAAATYAQLGQLQEAQLEAREVLRIEPSFTIGVTGKCFMVFKDTADADHLFEGLRKAGLP